MPLLILVFVSTRIIFTVSRRQKESYLPLWQFSFGITILCYQINTLASIYITAALSVCWDYFTLLGTLDLNLISLPSPVERHSSCSLKQLDPSNCIVNLFHRRRTKGWWQFYRKDDNGVKIEAVCETFVD